MHRTLVALVALSLAGPALADAELFAKKCANCHGKDGNPTEIGKKMGVKGALGATKLSEAEIVALVGAGKGKMPAYKEKLSEAEIASLARFVKAGLK